MAATTAGLLLLFEDEIEVFSNVDGCEDETEEEEEEEVALRIEW